MTWESWAAPPWAARESAHVYVGLTETLRSDTETRPRRWENASGRDRLETETSRPRLYIHPWHVSLRLWTCHASRPSVPRARRNGAVLFRWAVAAAVQLWRAGSESYISISIWLQGLSRESVEYDGGKCRQRQQSYLPELGLRPMFQNRIHL